MFDPDREQSRWLETQAQRVGFRLSTRRAIDESENASAVLALVDQHYDGLEGGLRTARRLRNESQASKVIMMTFDQSAAARASLADYADLILYKPISASDKELNPARGQQQYSPARRLWFTPDNHDRLMV